MDGFPPTRPSLLVRRRDPQGARAWSELVDIDAPIGPSLARSHGLQDTDGADILRLDPIGSTVTETSRENE